MRLLTHPLAAPGLALLILAAGISAWAGFPTDVVREWMAETGPVEMGTLALYLAALVAVVANRRFNPAPEWPALLLVIAGFCAREMDMHKYFTDVSVLKISYYSGPAPLAHKLMALAAWTPPALAALYLAARFARTLWRGLLTRRAVAVTVVTVLASIVVSKLSDRSLGVLTQDYGMAFNVSARALQLAIEEPVEMGIPVLVMLGLLQQRLET